MLKQIIKIENEIKSQIKYKEAIKNRKTELIYKLMKDEKTIYEMIKALSLIQIQIREAIDKETIFNNIPQTLENKKNDLSFIKSNIILFNGYQESIVETEEKIKQLTSTLNSLKQKKQKQGKLINNEQQNQKSN